jgi:pimeloyl-ACP methyl ester carboxylesterase
VIAQAAPDGPLVLVGHSMGGMTILAHAAREPRFAERVAGVALIATCAFWPPGRGFDPKFDRMIRIMGRWPRLFDRLRPWLSPPAHKRARWIAKNLFGVDPSMDQVREVAALVDGTPIATVARFLRALGTHDQRSALGRLRDVPTRILVGERDRLTPVSDSLYMKEQLPGAELTIIPGAGHMLTYERAQVVNDTIGALVARARARSAA